MAARDKFIVSSRDCLLLLVKFFACFFCVFFLTIIIIKKFAQKDELKANNESTENLVKTNIFQKTNVKTFIIVSIILFLAYVPYILTYYPGSVLIDSIIQILQGEGVIALSNHHPVLHTLIISMCMKIGLNVFNSYQTGAFIYTLLQTIATSLIFSYTIYYMGKKGISAAVRVITLLFYMFCPTICFYTITMYKDIPFALSILLITICICNIATNEKDFFKSKKEIIKITILITISMFFRNNGFYVILLMFPVMLISLKKYYKQIFIIFLVPIILYEIITGPIYNLLNIEQGSKREALSIPIQQFARLMTYKSNELSEEEKDKIQQYLPIDNFSELYNSGFADPVKSKFSEDGYNQDKKGLLKLYIKLAKEFPQETFESFIEGSYGYYYPNTVGWGIYTGVSWNEPDFKDYSDYSFDKKPILEIKLLEKLNEFVNSRDFPITSMVLSIGFLFWIILLCIAINIYNKKYKSILIFLPVLFIWLTALASPVYCEPRYVYSIFTCLPIFIAFTIKNENKIKME